MAQIDATVSVEIDSVFDVGGWQELGLPDLAGIGADEVAQRQVAARQNVQRGDELALEQRGVAGHQHAGAPEPGFGYARCRVPLEAHAESAVLAAVEGEYGGVDSEAGERLVDYAARESGRLRVAHHGGKEDIKVAATLRRPRWRSEEEDEEQCGKRTLHR